jgi:septation ring formation regulator EzrA
MKKVLTITLVVLLVGLMGLTACGGPSLTEQDIATIRGFGTRIDNLEAAVASLNSKLANINTSTLQTDVNQAKTDIAAIKTELEKLTTAGTENQTKVDALTAKVTELETRIKTLEAKLTPATPTADAITATIKPQFWDYVSLPANTISQDATLRLTLQNNSGKDLTDVTLSIGFYPSVQMVMPWTTGYPTLTGGITQWAISTYGGTTTSAFIFINGFGLSLKAGETKTINLTLSLRLTTGLAQEIRWEPDIYVEDAE